LPTRLSSLASAVSVLDMLVVLFNIYDHGNDLILHL